MLNFNYGRISGVQSPSTLPALPDVVRHDRQDTEHARQQRKAAQGQDAGETGDERPDRAAGGAGEVQAGLQSGNGGAEPAGRRSRAASGA